MAHIKVIVGALLACAVVAHGFPADAPVASSAFGIGSSSGPEPAKPFGQQTFGSTFAPRPLPGSFYPNQPTTQDSFGASSTVNRFVRDDSHEQASGRSTVSAASSSTAAPHRREATTAAATTGGRPLGVVYNPTTVRARRDETSALGGATIRPVQLPGSLAGASFNSGSTTVASKSKRDQTGSSTARTPGLAVTVPATFVKPSTSSVNKRDEGTQVFGSSGSTFQPAASSSSGFGSGSLAVKPLSPSTFAPIRNRREGTTSKPAASTSAAKPAKPLTTSAPKNKRDSSTTTAFPAKPVRPLRPSTSAFASTGRPFARPTTVESRPKRQAPVQSQSDESDGDDNRQLLNRPTLIPRPNRPTRPTNRPGGLFGWRTTTPLSTAVAGSSTTTAAATTAKVVATTSSSKFKRDQFPSSQTFKPFNTETFSGTFEPQPGQTTFVSGSSVSSNQPQGGFAGASAVVSSSGTPTHFNKRQTDGGDSSSGEESQSQED